ncbi:glycosyltransferase family 2 protein [Seonamhaeicola algicola]|uniref:Glycosyltransferase family 2 protein n=1 Tax=Seonamhaeicola algicola TaxID=1719036 RepID=A0A5C7AU81_9FLAO|nr:glycosyltransferase family 2 protein [Seonamhaeicola algicola]TXE11664.1 glycosyltransferase family 2 protein [Seonamhaeicola algicola]
MKTLTVFTPTYNRAYCLHQCYNSLVAQTNQDFTWLIIDDGSTDDTKTLVEGWIADNKISIRYHYQNNQGMHGGHNAAYRLIDTELNVCIDSDDFMPPEAVQHIISFWNSTPKKDTIAGFIGLDAYKDGTIIGQRLPKQGTETTLEALHNIHKVTGDKKLVLRTAVVKQYPPYPIFPNERFVPLGTLYLLIDQDYTLLCLNEVLCVVEYMEDGSSRNIIKQYYRHPKGFQYARRLYLKHSRFFKVRVKNAIHYISHSIQLRDANCIRKSPKPLLTVAMIPFGILLHLYVLHINKLKK